MKPETEIKAIGVHTMNRDSIHVTMTAPLRRAQVRQRLESLAARTGLPVAQLAGRALTIGLGQIEADLRLIFPAEPAPEQPTALEPAPEQPTALEPAPEPAQPTLSAAKSKPEATLRADRPDRVSSKAAARALNKTMTAFYARLHREPRLKRHSKLIGRAAMWDLAALRAEWAK